MTDHVEQRAGGRRLRLAVGQLGAEELGDALEQRLRERVEVERLVRYVVGPSIAVHTGLGTVGAVFVPVG
jgi:fatty acid-binding protein DegV